MRGSKIRVAALLAGLSLLGACSSPRMPPADPVDPVAQSEEIGRRLYENLCSNCHGFEGKGYGRLARLLTVPVPDLTTISERNGGEFPRQAVRDQIDGTTSNEAHGPRIMPAWGYSLLPRPGSDAEEDREAAMRQVENLVAYVKTIQK